MTIVAEAPAKRRRPEKAAEPTRHGVCMAASSLPMLAAVSSGEGSEVSGAFDAWQAAYDQARAQGRRLRDHVGGPARAGRTVRGRPTPPDTAGAPDAGEWPGVFPYTRGPYASMYRSKLWTMRMFAGFGTAEDTNARFRDLLRAGGDGLSVAYDLPTLMGRDSDDPLSDGEVGRCGVAVDTLADTEDLFARHRPVGHHHVDDHQLAGGDVLRHVRVGGGVGGHRSQAARGNAAERHAQGVPGPEGVHLPAPGVPAAGHRHHPLLRRRDAPFPSGVGVGLPHPRSRLDGRPRAGLHPGQRLRLRRGGPGGRPGRRRVRSPPLLLLQRPHRLLRGDRQVPGRPSHLGDMDARSLRRHRRPVADLPVPHPDRRRVSHRPATRAQHRAHGHRGVGRGARRNPEPAHQFDGRGARPPDRKSGPHRPAHPAGHRPRDRGGHRWPIRSVARGSSRP